MSTSFSRTIGTGAEVALKNVVKYARK